VELEAEEELGGQQRRSLVVMCRRWLQVQLGRDNGILLVNNIGAYCSRGVGFNMSHAWWGQGG
jgi:hypothetical protein